MRYQTVLLNSSFNRADFICGKSALDDYLQKQATQDIKRKVCAVFVLPHDNAIIKGYYTLSNGSIPRELVPIETLKKMPKYANLPTTLLGRLAVDRKFMRMRVGEFLLLDAFKRSWDVANTSIGSIAVVVDPLDNEAADFYFKYGFTKMLDSGRMILPMQTIAKLIPL